MSRFQLPKTMKRALNATIDQSTFDSESRTLEFPFSSEEPVDRWFGREILSHGEGAADFNRLNDSAPLLFNHNPDEVIGVVESAHVGEDKRGYAKVRFSKNERAQSILADIQDGILKNVSFGYRILDLEERSNGPKEPADFVATKWLPLEISVVSIPADQTVGIGRSEVNEEMIEVQIIKAGVDSALKGEKMEKETTPVVDVKVVQTEAVRAERERIAQITALGEKFGQKELARQLVDSDKSVDEARAAVLEKLGVTQKPVVEGEADLPLTKEEKRSYSIVKAINAHISGNWKDAGFERECSNTIAKRIGRETAGFFMPMNVTMENRATYAVGAAATGGNLVATDLLAGSFIDILRNKALVVQMGARMLSGLVGNVDIPRQSGATNTAWVGEGVDATKAEATFDKVSLSPKQIAARSQMTRLMLQQGTPDIEALVRQDLALQIALAIDLAAISGAGSATVPKGILNQSGIGSVALGTNGAAITIDAMIDLETAVNTANADAGSLGYLTNPKVVAALKKLKASGSGEYLWEQGDVYAAINGTPGAINGYPVGRTNQVPSNLTKGTGTNLSAVVFGNWSDLMIGEWGQLEILPNPYGAGYNAGSVDIRAMQTVDIAVRQAASFAAIVDAIA